MRRYPTSGVLGVPGVPMLKWGTFWGTYDVTLGYCCRHPKNDWSILKSIRWLTVSHLSHLSHLDKKWATSVSHLWRHIVTECCKQHTSSTPKRVDSTIELGPKEFFNDTWDRSDIPRDIGLTYHNSQRDFSANIVTECYKKHKSSTPKRVDSTIEFRQKEEINL